MDISLEFARTLLEGDQLARNDQLEHALVLYRNLVVLASGDPSEQALAQARMRRIEHAIEQQGVKVVQRTPIETAPSEEARAETLVNSGDLDGAIAIYQALVDVDVENQLLVERLNELQQRTRATLAADVIPTETAAARPDRDLDLAPVVQETAQARMAALLEQNWSADLPQDPVAMLEELLQRVRSNRRSAA